MRPHIRVMAQEACIAHGIRFEEGFGAPGQRRRFAAAVKARRTVIARLFDSSTLNRSRPTSATLYGVSEIARQLGLDHTTVSHAVTRLGLRRRERSGLEYQKDAA